MNRSDSRMKTLVAISLFVVMLALVFNQSDKAQVLTASLKLISIQTQDGGLIYGNLYGKGKKGVVLAHGGQFNKESWDKQARILVDAGFRVLAIDFRGYGQSKGPGQKNGPVHLDVLAAVR